MRSDNERLFGTARELGVRADAPVVFVCECGNPECMEYVKLTLDEYKTRRRADGFITAPGHAPPDDG